MIRRCLTALFLLAATGCLEHTETLQVRDDGSVACEIRIEGDPADVREGAPLPSPDSGWTVTDRTETDDAGKERLIRTATREVAPGGTLPSSFAPEGSRLAKLAPTFATSITVEQRPEGTYHHFRRTYDRRTWWSLEFLRREAFETDRIKGILARDPKTLTADDRAVLVRTLIDYGIREIGMLVQTAAEGLAEPLPQRAFLQARARAQAVYRDSKLADRVVGLLTGDGREEFAAVDQEVRRRVKEALEASLRDDGVAPWAIAAFLERLQEVRDAHDLTQDLSDEHWTVSVRLPGRIVADNADAGAGERPPGVVEWRFPGAARFDRDLILMATSLVPAEKR